jgi:hypothetical protein
MFEVPAAGLGSPEQEEIAVIDRNFPPENQGVVVDLAAHKAAGAKLTRELFTAVDVSVAEKPLANPLRKDDLVPTKSKSEILRRGVEAMSRLSNNHSRDWADWLKVLAALDIGRHAAMVEAGANQPRGRGYCTAFAKWLRCNEAFATIDQADRKRMFDVLDNLPVIEAWRANLEQSQQLKWNNPIIVLREWRRSLRSPKPPPGADGGNGDENGDGNKPAPLLPPQELRRQLEILGLARFRQEVLPPDWCGPLFDTILALASPDQLIAMLERKCSPSKGARVALKSLRKSTVSFS